MMLFAVPAAPLHAYDTAQPSRNPVANLNLEQLGNVEVTTVSKEPEEIWKTPAAIFVITQDDIRRSGARSIPEALRLAPGVEVSRIDASKWSIGIRGFQSRLNRSVLVLIDGREVYTTLFAGTYWEVQDTLIEDVERIEVIRGPGGTIWGPNAVNGVINIITRSSKDTHGSLVSVGGGNVSQGFFDARYGTGHGTGLDYRVYLKGFVDSPEFHNDRRNYDAWRGIQSGFRTDWQRDPKNTFSLQGDIYYQGMGEQVTGTNYNPPEALVLDGTAPLSGGNILGKWKRSGSAEDMQVQAYYDRTNRHELNFADIRDTFDVDFLQRWRLPWRQQVSWGLGGRSTRIHDIELYSGLVFAPAHRTDYLITAFLQDDIQLVRDRLTLALGNKFVGTNLTDLQLEPSVRLMWNPSQTQTLWASFTHAVRAPSDVERNFSLSGFLGTVGGLPFFARFNPNPNFRPEQLNGYELGYRRLLGPNLYFDLASFYNHYGNLFSEDITGPLGIETSPAPTHVLLPAEFGNGLAGVTKGVEFAPEWRPAGFMRLRASYSFLQIRINKTPGSRDVGTASSTEGSSPRHQFSAQAGFDVRKQFSFDVNYRFISALSALKVRSYSTADARFEWQASDAFTFAVAGSNLFQPHHSEFPTDPGPTVEIKRSIYGQVTWQK